MKITIMNKVYLLSRITNKFFVKIKGRFGSTHSLYNYADKCRNEFEKNVRRLECLILIERLGFDVNNIVSKLTDYDMNLSDGQVDSFYSDFNRGIIIAANYIHIQKNPQYMTIYNNLLKGEKFVHPYDIRFSWKKCKPMQKAGILTTKFQ